MGTAPRSFDTGWDKKMTEWDWAGWETPPPGKNAYQKWPKLLLPHYRDFFGFSVFCFGWLIPHVFPWISTWIWWFGTLILIWFELLAKEAVEDPETQPHTGQIISVPIPQTLAVPFSKYVAVYMFVKVSGMLTFIVIILVFIGTACLILMWLLI